MSLLDDAISARNSLYEPTPSITQQKEASVEAATVEKQGTIYTPEIVTKIEDGDTSTFLGGNEKGDRQTGYDTYETYHGPLDDSNPMYQGKDGLRRYNTTLDILDRQRTRYAEQFNVPRELVTNEDIWEEGAKQGLNNLYQMTRSKNDADQKWTPGDTSYYRDNEMGLGSDENPLNIPVYRSSEGNDKYGRPLTHIYNPESMVDVNAVMTNRYNPSRFSKETGFFDKEATEDAKAEAAGWKGKKPSEMNGLERDLMRRSDYGRININDDGRLLTDLKQAEASGVRELASLGAAAMGYLERGKEAVTGKSEDGQHSAWKDIKAKLNKIATKPEIADKEIGVNKEHIEKKNREIAKQVNKIFKDDVGAVETTKAVGEAFATAISGADLYMTDNAAQTGMLMASLPFKAAAIESATHKNIQKYKNNHDGEEPDARRVAEMYALNALLLLPEALIFNPAMKKFMGALGVTGKASLSTAEEAARIVKETQKGVARRVGSRTGDVAKTTGKATVFESVQETLQQSSDKYVETDVTPLDYKKKDWKESVIAGVTGAGAGGGFAGSLDTSAALLQGVTSTLKAKRIAEGAKKAQEQIKAQDDVDLNDVEFIDIADEANKEQRAIDTTVVAAGVASINEDTTLEEIEKSIGTENSNEYIEAAYGEQKQAAAEKIGRTKSDDVAENILEAINQEDVEVSQKAVNEINAKLGTRLTQASTLSEIKDVLESKGALQKRTPQERAGDIAKIREGINALGTYGEISVSEAEVDAAMKAKDKEVVGAIKMRMMNFDSKLEGTTKGHVLGDEIKKQSREKAVARDDSTPGVQPQQEAIAKNSWVKDIIAKVRKKETTAQKVMQQLKSKTTKALTETLAALPDTNENAKVRRLIQKTLDNRKVSDKGLKIDTAPKGVLTEKPTGLKHEILDTFRQALGQKKIENKEYADSLLGMINELETDGSITSKEAEILRKRHAKVSEGAKSDPEGFKEMKKSGQQTKKAPEPQAPPATPTIRKAKDVFDDARKKLEDKTDTLKRIADNFEEDVDVSKNIGKAYDELIKELDTALAKAEELQKDGKLTEADMDAVEKQAQELIDVYTGSTKAAERFLTAKTEPAEDVDEEVKEEQDPEANTEYDEETEAVYTTSLDPNVDEDTIVRDMTEEELKEMMDPDNSYLDMEAIMKKAQEEAKCK